jgi:hypothetical protein
MVFAPHVRVTALGRLGTPQADRFSYGFNIAPDDGFVALGDWAGMTAAQITDLCDSVRDFHHRGTTLISAAAVLEQVKLAIIGADGKYMADPVTRDYSSAGGVPLDSTTLPQSACAVSLGTNRRGPTGRGRFFIPMIATVVDQAQFFHTNVAQADGLRDSAATMLNDINNWPGIDVIQASWRVCIASTKGYNSKVNSVRVGRVIDTIRTRRNKLPEAYTATAAVA